MTQKRKTLDSILENFDVSPAGVSSQLGESIPQNQNSLVSQIANPKRKITKIRFTLDLEKPLDDRFTKIAKRLNRSKADLARIAISRMLDELDAELNQQSIK